MIQIQLLPSPGKEEAERILTAIRVYDQSENTRHLYKPQVSSWDTIAWIVELLQSPAYKDVFESYQNGDIFYRDDVRSDGSFHRIGYDIEEAKAAIERDMEIRPFDMRTME